MTKRIKKYINQRGISQAEFARRVGVKAERLWRWLMGVQSIPPDQIEKIDAFLKSEGL